MEKIDINIKKEFKKIDESILEKEVNEFVKLIDEANDKTKDSKLKFD